MKIFASCFIMIFSIIMATNCYSQFSFDIEGPITITGSAYDITVGNFNNAGRLEAIVTHAQNYNNTTPSSSNIVTYIKYNTGSSVWESSIFENTGGYASQAVTSGDYDSDGNRDFAFTSYCNCGNYYLYQGNGADGFTNVTPTFSGNRFSFDMITGDLNNDGKTDIVTGGNTVLSKFLNTSTGANNFSFNKSSFIISSSDNSSYGYSLADFNGDGFKDIVATVPGEAKIRVLLNDGAGGFNSAVYTDYNITGTSMSNIRGVATGDFNDDGYPDIVAASYNGNAIGVLINSADGLGTFNPVVLYSVTTPQWIEVGDLNIDGNLDIAVVTNNNISLFSGNGDGTFASTPYVYALTLARRLAIADMNNDGRNDIAAISNTGFTVLINKTGSYEIAVTDAVCYGGSYTFPDGTTQNNITAQVVHTSNLLTVVNSYDSIITTTVHVNPIYNSTETGYVCSGASYTFPDGTTQNNITAQVTHTSNLVTVGSMCDSIITTTVNVNPTYNQTATEYVCSGASYTFPDGTTQNNITAQVTHTSNLVTVGSMCDSIITTTVNVNPTYNHTETEYVCSGASYTFPDGNTQNNITAQLVHTSNLVTAGSMCDSIITTTVNVNPTYNYTETDSVCSGASYTFPDGNTQNNITAQVIHTSNFQSAATLCDSIIVTTINVTAVEASVSVTGFTITADAVAASYQWLDCDNGYSEIMGEVSQSFTPAINGNYAVEVSQNSCADTSVCTLISGLGIIDNGFCLKTRLYPNPTEGIVHVVFDKEYSDIHIVIKDVTGRALDTENYLNTKMISINLQQVTGVYFIEISTESEKAVFKILKI